MINRDCFVSFIKQITEFRKEQREATSMLHNALNMDGHSVLLFGDQMVDALVDLLSMSFDSKEDIKEMEDIEDLIIWFLYEMPVNKDKQVNLTIDEKNYIVHDAKSLYNAIIRIYKKRK